MPQFYDCGSKACVELTVPQYEFLIALVESLGDISIAIMKYPISLMVLEEYKKDTMYWPVVKNAVELTVRARKLTPEYLRDFAMGAFEGTKQPTRAQTQIFNSSMRLLGLTGLPNRTGRVVVTPESVEISFSELSQIPQESGIPQIPQDLPKAIPQDITDIPDVLRIPQELPKEIPQ